MSINLGIRDHHIANEFTLPAPVATAATSVDYDSFYTNWTSVAIASGYYLDVAYDIGFTSYVVGYQNLDVGNVTTYLVDSLLDGDTYYYRLRAYIGMSNSTNSNTITTTTETIYTVCATYGPYLDPEPINDEMFLSCGSLYLTSGTIGHYVIEWNLDSVSGATQFVSGDDQLFDGDIQAEHPLVNEVVFAGDLYPVIRYIYVDGIKYTSTYEVGARYSPDLAACLGYYTIFCIECTTLYGGDATYPNFKLSYSRSVDIGYDKSRTIKYCICPDMDYLAWSFNPDQVSDQLKVYYCTALDLAGILVDNFVVGQRSATGTYLTSNLNPGSYPTDPRIYRPTSTSYPLKFITDLTGFTYTAGDYLRIEIIGSCLETTITNTDWELKLQWMNALDLDNSFYSTSISKPSAAYTMAWAADPTCQYKVSAPTTVIPDSTTTAAYWLSKYTMLRSVNTINGDDYSYCLWKISTSASTTATSGYNFAENRAGLISISKTTSDFTFTFASTTDYDWYKAWIATIQAGTSYTEWLTSTPSDVEYFRGYTIYHMIGIDEGDDYNTVTFYIHFSSTITYDDINKTINFTFEIPTNPFVAADCDNTASTVDSFISILTTTKNYTIAPAYADTYISSKAPFGVYRVYQAASYYSTYEYYSYFYVEEVLLNNIFDLTTQGFCRILNDSYVGYHQRLYRMYNRLTLTDTTDHASRLANWKYERRVFLRTDDCADFATWEIVQQAP